MLVRKLDTAAVKEVYDLVRADDLEPGLLDVRYEHVQSVPAATWQVVHNLGKAVDVEVVDNNGVQIECEVVYQTANEIVLRFNRAVSGKAIVT